MQRRTFNFDHEHWWGRCRHVGVEGMGSNANTSVSGSTNANANGQHEAWYPLPQPSSMVPTAPVPVDQTPIVLASPPPFNPLKAYEGWEKQQAEMIEAEKAHFAKVSLQAGDIMVELTEATLESVLTTADASKAKLAEHRAERDKQQMLIDEQIEAQHRDPPRLV